MAKNLAFHRRIGFALFGLREAYRREQSFRIQVTAGVFALGVLIPFRPPAIWWALFLILIGLIWSLELINTAMEAMLDRVHPDLHDSIRLAKDCAAAAVLVMSLVSVLVFVIFVFAQSL